MGDVKPFRFYSGHVGEEFGRNELLPGKGPVAIYERLAAVRL